MAVTTSREPTFPHSNKDINISVAASTRSGMFNGKTRKDASEINHKPNLSLTSHSSHSSCVLSPMERTLPPSLNLQA